MTHKERYQSYLESDEWKLRRKIAIDYAEGRCQLCDENKKPLNVHHRHYRNLGHEPAQDLVVLCRKCHEKFHAKSPLTREQLSTIFWEIEGHVIPSIPLGLKKEPDKWNPVANEVKEALFDFWATHFDGVPNPVVREE